MAVDLNKVAYAIKETFEEPWTESMDRDNFLLQRFGREDVQGPDVRWKIHYAGNQSASAYSENDEIPEAGSQAYTEARVPIKQNWVVVEVTGLVQAATKGGGGYMDVLANETKEALEDLKDNINTQLMASTADGSGRSLHGLGYIISDVGVYAGIDRSVNTWWQSYVNDNGGTPRPLTIALMQDVMTEMEKTSRKGKVSVILTNRKHWYDYGNLLTPDRRFTSTEKLDGGFMAIDFEGIPVVAVPNLPTGVMYFLDESEFGYHVLQNFETKPKSTNKDSDRFIITHYSQLRCNHPGRQAKIVDLA